MGKHLENAVDNFIDYHYEKKESVDDTEISYLAFFDKTDGFKKLLVEECKFLKTRITTNPYFFNFKLEIEFVLKKNFQ